MLYAFVRLLVSKKWSCLTILFYNISLCLIHRSVITYIQSMHNTEWYRTIKNTLAQDKWGWKLVKIFGIKYPNWIWERVCKNDSDFPHKLEHILFQGRFLEKHVIEIKTYDLVFSYYFHVLWLPKIWGESFAINLVSRVKKMTLKIRSDFWIRKCAVCSF